MSILPLVILDLGGTLIGGPAVGPARRISDLAGVDPGRKAALHTLLMTVDFSGPDEVAAWAQDRLGMGGTELSDAIVQIWTAQRSEAFLLPGVREALDRLTGHCRFAVLSNIWTPYLESARAALGDFLDRNVPPGLQVFSCQVGLVKPARELFTSLLDRAETSADRAIMVGDHYTNDVAPALAMGMRAIWISDVAAEPGGAERPPRRFGAPDLTIPSFSHLSGPEMVEELVSTTTFGTDPDRSRSSR